MHTRLFSEIPVWLVPFLGLAWLCFILNTIAVAGGWRKLARRYPAYTPPDGPKFNFQSGKLGWAAYNNCLTYCAAFNGLYVAVFPLVSFGHRPLLIPWGEIRAAEEKRVFFRSYAVLTIGAPEIARLTIPKKVFDASAQYLRHAAGNKAPQK